MSLAALRELRRLFPSSSITLASPSGTADVFLDNPFADHILIQQTGLLSTFKNARVWRRRRFNLAVLFQNAFAAASTARLAGVPVRAGYDTDHRGSLLSTAIPLPEWKDERHESFYYLNIVAELESRLLGASSLTDAEPRPEMFVSDERKVAARRTLEEAGAQLRKPVAIICPGSVNSRAKRWPAERYAQLVDRLTEAGMGVVLIGSPGESRVSVDVSSRAKSEPILLTGKTTVAEAVAIISVGDLLITNDTGPAHIGAALGTPTLVIFGPTNPLTTYPLSSAAEIIRRPPDCAPCMLRDCPIDHRCMTAISTEQVLDRAIAMVGTRSARISG